jgi:hypothetical protein
MKRCNYCFRYALDQPTFCPYCGRSYDVRLCPRGHVNPRNVQFCATCGSDELSTPAPPESLLGRLSRWTLKITLYMTAAVMLMAIGAGLVASLDWSMLAQPLVALLLMLGVIYWTTTLLPGPIKKVGKAAGRQIAKSVKSRRKR